MTTHWRRMQSRYVAAIKRRDDYDPVAVVQAVRCSWCGQQPGQPCVTHHEPRPPHAFRIMNWREAGSPTRHRP